MISETEPKRKRLKLADDAFQQDVKGLIQINIDIFDDYLDKVFSKTAITKAHAVPKKFFNELHSNYFNKNDSAVSELFETFCDASSKNFTSIYKATILLFEILGYDVKTRFDFDVTFKSAETYDLSLSLKIASNIYKILSRIKSNEEVKISEVSFSDFTKSVILSTIQNAQPTEDVIQLIINAIETEPMIVEPLISDVLPYVMLSDAGEKTENYKILLMNILEVCVKLHRLPNLISKMLPSIKSRLDGVRNEKECFPIRIKCAVMDKLGECGIGYVLPQEFLEAFSQHLIGLAGWEVINLMKTFLFHLEAFVQNLHDVAADTSKHIYIEILATMLCQFLSSVKVVEHTTQDLIVSKFVICMADLKKILGTLGCTLLEMNHNQNIMRAYLNICYIWGDLYVLLKTRDGLTNEVNGITKNDYHMCCISYVHSYLTAEQWCLVIERVSNFGQKLCKRIMQLLQLQSIKAIYAFEEDIEDTNSLFCRCSLQNQALEHIFTDPFVLRVLVPKFDDDTISSLSKHIIKQATDQVEENLITLDMLNCPKLLENVCVNLLLKICRGKQTEIKDLIFRIKSEGDLTAIIEKTDENIEVFKAYFESTTINEDKILSCLNLMEKLRILSLCGNVQYAVFLCAGALMEVLKGKEDYASLKQKVATIVTELFQCSYKIFSVMKPSYILNFMLTNVDDYKSAFVYWIENISRESNFPDNYGKTVKYLLKKFKSDETRRTCAIVMLDTIYKNRKLKIYVQHKKEVADGRDNMYDCIVEWLSSCDKNSKEYVHFYAVAIKYYLTVDGEKKDSLLADLDEVIKIALIHCQSGNIEGELLLFTTILRHKHQLKSVNTDTMLEIWDIVKNLDVSPDLRKDYSGLIMLIFEHISNEEFSKICSDLLTSMKSTIQNSTSQVLLERMGTIKSILQCSFNPIKSTVWKNAVESILNELVNKLKCNDKLFQDEVVAFEEAVIQTNHLMLTEIMIAAIFRSISIILPGTTTFVRTYKQCSTLLNLLLKYRKPQIMDRLPPYLVLYRLLLTTLAEASDSSRNLEKTAIEELADCGHQIEKLTRILVTCGKNLDKVVEFIIPHVLAQYEKYSMYSSVKIHFDNSVYMLISRLDQYSNAHLMRCLSTASSELFKYYHGNYNKHYRFTGKV